MRREVRARWLAAATAIMVVALSAVFAWLRNAPIGSVPAAGSTMVADARVAAGRRAFAELGCANCHAIGNLGNPTRPLDGIGARRDAAAIRDWALGTGEALSRLPPSVVRVKARAADAAELAVLVDYLATLK
ncbi:MAG TPA: c-type cytochrome [Burkholderiaceae bacterium]|nr:c-type cytochrome [Burkholderiaceae bacterium]